jgi:hypothetical protein
MIVYLVLLEENIIFILYKFSYIFAFSQLEIEIE